MSALIGSLAVLGLGAAPAAADSSVELPIAAHADIVVDGVNEHVFISDPNSGSLLVTDYEGAVVEQITSLPGAYGLALSGDSAKLYVTLRSGDAIAVIDTGTLQQVARHETGAGTAPKHTALAGGKLWFSYGADGSGSIGSLDISSADPQVALVQDDPYSWYSAPLLASSPGDSGVLVAAAPGQSPVEVAVYDVSTGTPQGQAYRWNPGSDGSGNLRDLAVTPDGEEVILASGSPYYHHAYRTSDLSASGRYTSDSYPNAVAIAPDGTIAGGIQGSYSPDLYLFDRGDSAAFRSYDFPRGESSSTLLRPRGLAWAPDGSRLFALSESYGTGVTMQVLDEPKKADTTLTVQAPASVPMQQDVTLSGELGSAAAFGTGTTVEVSRDDNPANGPGGTGSDSGSDSGTVIGTAEVAPDGTFTFTDRPRHKGEVRYTVRYAGDAHHAGAVASATVTVE